MYKSDPVTNIVPALIKAQTAMKGASRDAVNPHYKSKFADFNAVVEVVKKPLNENGIVYLQPVERSLVRTYLFHESGEWIADDGVEIKIPESKAGDPQAQGSAITYARRYGLKSLLGLPDEDDDGESAMDRSTGSDQIVETFTDDLDEELAAQPASKPCPHHPTLLLTRKVKGDSVFYSHRLPSGAWCNGK